MEYKCILYISAYAGKHGWKLSPFRRVRPRQVALQPLPLSLSIWRLQADSSAVDDANANEAGLGKNMQKSSDTRGCDAFHGSELGTVTPIWHAWHKETGRSQADGFDQIRFSWREVCVCAKAPVVAGCARRWSCSVLRLYGHYHEMSLQQDSVG